MLKDKPENLWCRRWNRGKKPQIDRLINEIIAEKVPILWNKQTSKHIELQIGKTRKEALHDFIVKMSET